MAENYQILLKKRLICNPISLMNYKKDKLKEIHT